MLISGPALRAERAEIDQPLDAQREEVALLVEREFAGQIGGAAVMIAGQRLRARAESISPARPVRFAASITREKFRIDFVANAEAAADIGGADAEFLRPAAR